MAASALSSPVHTSVSDEKSGKAVVGRAVMLHHFPRCGNPPSQ